MSELADDSAKKLACETAKEARAGLGAEPIVSGQYPVILKNSVMAELQMCIRDSVSTAWESVKREIQGRHP